MEGFLKADSFFTSDTAKAVKAVNDLELPTGCQFTQSQFDALVSLAFNAGPGVLTTDDIKAMLAHGLIYSFVGPLTPAESDTCSKLVSKAFSYDTKLKPRRNEEAT